MVRARLTIYANSVHYLHSSGKSHERELSQLGLRHRCPRLRLRDNVCLEREINIILGGEWVDVMMHALKEQNVYRTLRLRRRSVADIGHNAVPVPVRRSISAYSNMRVLIDWRRSLIESVWGRWCDICDEHILISAELKTMTLIK